jgi:hypothetical protein
MWRSITQPVHLEDSTLNDFFEIFIVWKYLVLCSIFRLNLIVLDLGTGFYEELGLGRCFCRKKREIKGVNEIRAK